MEPVQFESVSYIISKYCLDPGRFVVVRISKGHILKYRDGPLFQKLHQLNHTKRLPIFRIRYELLDYMLQSNTAVSIL